MTRDHTKKVASIFCSALVLCWVLGALVVEKTWCQEPEQEIHELETGFYYTIKKGDTLWDLSQRFFDSPWIWPDMWEKNRDLPNPHWIYPGDKIRVFSREGMESTLTNEEKILLGLEPSATSQEETPAEYFFYPAIDSVGFLKRDSLPPSGTIFKVRREYKEIIGEGDIVSIRPAPGTIFEPGEQYTIFREARSYNDEKTNAFIGVQHLIVGIVDIFEVYDEGIATAVVYRSFRNIEIDDVVTPYYARSPHIRILPSAQGILGSLVAHESEHIYFGDQEVVYIDKGRKDGIEVGQYYNMFYQHEQVFGSGIVQEFVSLAPVNTGELLILHAEDTTASAVITTIHDAIKAGMQIRTP